MSTKQLDQKKSLMVFSGQGNDELSTEISECLGVPLGEVVLSSFANGELYCRFGESVRGADVFLIQSHCPPINDHIFQQLIMADAAKRASAKRITAVCPFYAYARQDRKAEGREPITARLLADLLTAAGCDRVVTVDLHTGQIQGFFDMPVDHLTAVPILAAHLGEGLDGDISVVSPDAGGGKLAYRWVNQLAQQGIDAEIAFIDKRRPKGTHNVAQAVEVVGDIADRTCVLVDDMIDTAGTITSAADLLHARGCPRRDRHRHPRGVLRPGHRPAEECARSAGWSSRTRCRSPTTSAGTPSPSSRSRRSSPRRSTRCSPTRASARSSAATTSESPPDAGLVPRGRGDQNGRSPSTEGP